MYLGKDSPLYGPGQLFEPNPARPRKPMGNKQFVPDFSKMLALVSLLVRTNPPPSHVHTHAYERG
jgi:hypothetical protein